MIRRHQFRPTAAVGTMLAVILIGTLVAPVSARGLAAGGYAFTSYAYPHDTFTQLLSVNNGGRIAGYHGAKVNKGFELRLPASAQSENFPGSAQTQVVGINNHGDTVGFYVDTKNITHGFYFNHGVKKWSSVDVPGTGFNQLLGVDDSGNAAGYYQFGKNNVFQPFTRTPGGAFRLPPIPNAQMTDINNAGDVTGFEVVSGSSTRAFVVLGSTVRYFQYPGATFTQALGLNNQHMVVGTYNDKAGNAHGFTYNLQTKAFKAINVPNSTSTVVNGLNDHGWLVGFYTAANKNTVGFVAKPG
jgi:hypothetical protein